MQLRRLGPFGVSCLGLGCMNLSHAYGTPPPAEATGALLLRALDRGITHFDTAALYGFGANEALLGKVLKPHRNKIFLASKCGMTGVSGRRVIDGRPQTLKRTCEESLGRLQTEVIDLYYLHRWDRQVPIEDSVGALAWLLAKGNHILPLFGTRSCAHLDENAGAAAVTPDAGLVARLDALINQQSVAGPRYNAATQREIDTETYPGDTT